MWQAREAFMTSSQTLSAAVPSQSLIDNRQCDKTHVRFSNNSNACWGLSGIEYISVSLGAETNIERTLPPWRCSASDSVYNVPVQ